MLALPIDPLLPEVVATLARDGALVLEAPPGAGKTTRVPRAILDAGAVKGEILVLEPRRLAARMAARRVADELGDRLGGVVGYQVRFEDVSSSSTRIRFVTEGVLTRRLLHDPDLRGISVIVLDEFHERHLHGDVALALVRRLRATRRPDLGVVVMSATLAAQPIADYLGCTTLRSEGRLYEVATEHLAATDDRHLDKQVASAVRRLCTEGLDGDVLVFLPGAGEIRRARETCEAIAQQYDLLLVPLHGDLSPAEQDRAVNKADRRKIILSTNVAESSVTIDGVVAVVDSGLARVAQMEPWSGLPVLRTERISRASATQRTGRAGRTRPGRCLRLYTKADHDTRPERDAPEIRRLDLTQTWLELRASDVGELAWLEAPPAPSVRAAEELLVRLGAFDDEGAVTELGRRMLRFALHPRQARLLVEAERRGVAKEGAILAALVGERDLRSSAKARFDAPGGMPRGPRAAPDRATEKSDLILLLDLFREAQASSFSAHAMRAIGLDAGATLAVDRARKQLERGLDTRAPEPHEPEEALLMSVLAGYPDRVAKRLAGRRVAIAGGGAAELSEESAVRDAQWLVAVDADAGSQAGAQRAYGKASGTIVRLASAIEPEWLLDLFRAPSARRARSCGTGRPSGSTRPSACSTRASRCTSRPPPTRGARRCRERSPRPRVSAGCTRSRRRGRSSAGSRGRASRPSTGPSRRRTTPRWTARSRRSARASAASRSCGRPRSSTCSRLRSARAARPGWRRSRPSGSRWRRGAPCASPTSRASRRGSSRTCRTSSG